MQRRAKPVVEVAFDTEGNVTKVTGSTELKVVEMMRELSKMRRVVKRRKATNA